jgi:hypothetical protein
MSRHRYGPGSFLRTALHNDVASATANLDEPMLREDPAYVSPREAA